MAFFISQISDGVETLSEKTRERIFWLFFVSIFLLALALRLYALENRPVHHDEGVNGWFIDKLVSKGDYKYSREHYHGPTMFYMGWFFAKIFGGLSLFSIRVIPGLFGTLLCACPLFVRKDLGRSATLGVALLLAVSPANLFYSRYAIHETVFVCFYTLTAVCFFSFLFEAKEISLMLGALFLSYAAATKETIVVILAALGFGFLCSVLFNRDGASETWKRVKKQFNWRNLAIAVILIFVGLWLWFGFKGILEFFKSYAFYFNLGSGEARKSGHEKTWDYFFKLLWNFEWFLVVGGISGAIAALIRRRPFDLFCLGWALAVILVHSAIAYKTPWLIINITTPLCFLSGILVSVVLDSSLRAQIKGAVLAAFLTFSAVSFYGAWALSFVIFYEPDNAYTYVHTYPTGHVLEKRIKSFLQQDPKAHLDIFLKEYWPFPFLLRQYDSQISYWGNSRDKSSSVLILANENQHAEVLRAIEGKDYVMERYPIRSAVISELFVEKEFFKKAIVDMKTVRSTETSSPAKP